MNICVRGRLNVISFCQLLKLANVASTVYDQITAARIVIMIFKAYNFITWISVLDQSLFSLLWLMAHFKNRPCVLSLVRKLPKFKMGNSSSTDKMMKVQFDLKFAAKNFERESKKCYAREKKAKAQVRFLHKKSTQECTAH